MQHLSDRSAIVLVFTIAFAVSGCSGNAGDVASNHTGAVDDGDVDPRLREYVPSFPLGSLDYPDSYELLSLDPEELDDPPPGHFHRFRVLGRTPISGAKTRTKLNDALFAGEGDVAACFEPRHGISSDAKRPRR